MNKEYLNIIFLILLLIILIYYLKILNILEENYRNLFGFGGERIVNLHNCSPENNCFLGSYARTQIYQNVCEPKDGLLRQKISLNDDCQRGIKDYMESPKYFFKCDVNKHLQRRCQWIKK